MTINTRIRIFCRRARVLLVALGASGLAACAQNEPPVNDETLSAATAIGDPEGDVNARDQDWPTGLPVIDPRTVKVVGVELEMTGLVWQQFFASHLEEEITEQLSYCANDGTPLDVVLRFDSVEDLESNYFDHWTKLWKGKLVFKDPGTPEAVAAADLEMRFLSAEDDRTTKLSSPAALGAVSYSLALLATSGQSYAEVFARNLCIEVFKRRPDVGLKLAPKAAN